jgi:hypothetical protein
MAEFDTKELIKILNYLDKRYNAVDGSKSLNSVEKNKLLQVYSRAAVIELGGWVEDSLDEMFYNLANSKIVGIYRNESFCNVVRKTYGFLYKDHIVPIVKNLFILSDKDFVSYRSGFRSHYLKSSLPTKLEYLWKFRCEAAHKHVVNISNGFPSPSAWLYEVGQIQPFLKDFATLVRSFM